MELLITLSIIFSVLYKEGITYLNIYSIEKTMLSLPFVNL